MAHFMRQEYGEQGMSGLDNVEYYGPLNGDWLLPYNKKPSKVFKPEAYVTRLSFRKEHFVASMKKILE